MDLRLTLLAVASALCMLHGTSASRHLVHINEEMWREMLKGEWLVEFYAPWCPTCKELSRAWSALAEWSRDQGIRIAAIDVTQNPGLSGRFLVTALPTIYHIKEGVFRVYEGPKDKDDFISFLENRKWSTVDPMARWRYPDSIQMSAVSTLFKMSMSVRDAHNTLVEKHNIPVWGSYVIFAGATLFLGCILGFFIVAIIDRFFTSGVPAAGSSKSSGKQQRGGSGAKSTSSKEHQATANGDTDSSRLRKPQSSPRPATKATDDGGKKKK